MCTEKTPESCAISHRITAALMEYSIHLEEA